MVTTRIASTSDIAALSKHAEKTFYDAWKEFNTEENMALFAAQHFTPEILKKEIANKKTFFLLAFLNEELAGYCKVKENNSKKELKNIQACELEKLYVEKNFQNKKIGEHLLNKATIVAIEKGFQTLWLSVWKPNTRAIKFYERNGFKIFSEQKFILGNDVQEDFLMKKNLVG